MLFSPNQSLLSVLSWMIYCQLYIKRNSRFQEKKGKGSGDIMLSFKYFYNEVMVFFDGDVSSGKYR